jgi:hypothetical protein
LFPGDHSPPNNADIEPGWSNTSTPPYTSYGACRGYCTYQHNLQVPVRAYSKFQRVFHVWYFNTGSNNRTEWMTSYHTGQVHEMIKLSLCTPWRRGRECRYGSIHSEPRH